MLGRALEARAEEVRVEVAGRFAPDAAPDGFASSALATSLIGRWLATGKAATAEEHKALAGNGQRPLQGTFSLADLTKSYLVWRDATMSLIDEECRRHDLSSEARQLAIRVVQASCDSSLVRMTRHFDLSYARLQRLVDEERLRLAQAALHDPLTGLANRIQLLDYLHMRSCVPGTHTALLFIDLDHFKAINDRFGHQRGDELLVSVARRLEGAVRSGDVIARFGGDEFVIMVPLDAHDGLQAVKLAQRIQNALDEPFCLSKEIICITASIGVALAAPGLSDEEALIRADQAMYAAKQGGRARLEIYSAELGTQADRRSQVGNEVPFAVEREELELQYQAIVTRDGAGAHAEALCVEATPIWDR